MSRIHVVIYYDKLRMEDRRQIWSQFFNKLEDEREDFFITRRAKAFVLEDDTICEIEWNGREIRNGNNLSIHASVTNAVDSFPDGRVPCRV